MAAARNPPYGGVTSGGIVARIGGGFADPGKVVLFPPWHHLAPRACGFKYSIAQDSGVRPEITVKSRGTQDRADGGLF